VPAETPNGDPWTTLLRAAIIDRFGSVRGYAKFRAERVGNGIENERRLINKWLDGTRPTKPEHLETIEEDLGLPAEMFARQLDEPAPFATAMLGRIVTLLEQDPDGLAEIRPLLEREAAALEELAVLLREAAEERRDAG
jgi:hypothetical protein